MDWRQKAVIYAEAIVAGAISAWAGLPWTAQTLMVLNGLDIIGGYIVGVQAKDTSSKVMWKGITKKVYVWLIIGATHQLWGQGSLDIASVVTGAYCVWELKSLLEKAALIGIPIPGILLRSMRVMQDKYEGAKPPTQEQPTDGDSNGR